MGKILLIVSLLLLLSATMMLKPPVLRKAVTTKAPCYRPGQRHTTGKEIFQYSGSAASCPVVLSLFFGITCLSGTSILCNMGILPKNEFLMGNKALNNWLVFAVFLALSIATSLPKWTALSKGFGEAIDQLETYAGIISYFGIYYLSVPGQDETTKQVVYAAGIFSFTKRHCL